MICTYSGPQTVLNEVTPVGNYIGQFFKLPGFTVVDEWYILSEFHGSIECSIKGRIEDIRRKPDENDLKK